MDEEGAPRDLRAFLNRLRQRGELREVRAAVDPKLEIAEIHRRVVAANGPALWFRNVKGSPFSTVTNLFGTRARVDAAFGRRPQALVRGLADFVQNSMPPTPGAIWRHRDVLMPWVRLGAKTVHHGPVSAQRMDPPRLRELPITTSWSEDGGPTMTLPIVYTEHPTTGVPNLGIYRMQRYDDVRTGMHWQLGKGGGFHHHVAEACGEKLPVSVSLGGPPAALLGALAPLPENVPELLIASLALGGRLRLTRDPDHPLPVLADAEVALLGHVSPDQRAPEGPFGDHYGYYSLQHPYPVFECQKVLHRVDAVIPATVVGKPRQEDYYLGDYLQELLSPLFPLAMPSVRDLWSYGETGFHSLATAVVRERYHREAMAAAFRVLGEGQLSLTKFLFVIDKELRLADFPTVLSHVLERFRPECDLYVFSHLAMDSLDYTGPRLERGSKGVMLGLGEPVRDLPRSFRGDLPAGIDVALPFVPGCLVVGGTTHAEDPDLPRRLAGSTSLEEWPLVVISDEPLRAAASCLNFLWTTFTRFDPARDLVSKEPRIVSNHVAHSLPLVIDARMRESYPDELFCDEQTRQTVHRRWNEYFPGGLDQGDSDRGHLDAPLSRSDSDS